jgi:hypothetical protein
MSTATVTVFDPQGTMRDIPQSELPNAVKQGGTPGVRVQAPDGTIHVVPAPKIHEAYQNGGKLLPIEDQETPHPGFWSAVAEDAVPMLKSIGTAVLTGAPGMAYRGIKQAGNDLQAKIEGKPTAAEAQNEAQKAAGYGPVYRHLLTPLAQGVGVNVPGMEASAASGDVGGVLGHTAVPSAAAVAPLAAEGIVRAAQTPLASKIGQTAVTGAKMTGRVADVATFDRLTAAYKAAKGIAGDVRHIKDIWSPETPAEPVPQTPSVPASQAPSEQSVPSVQTSPGFRMPPVKQPTPVPPIKAADFAVKDVIDEAIPPENKAANMKANAAVEFYLKKGNVKAAENALDEVAKNPAWPPERPQYRGGTNDIREATKFRTPADIAEDHAIQQEMGQNLERHGEMAEEDARKEFIARNSTGITKGELTGKLPSAEGQAVRGHITARGAKSAQATPATADLTDILQQSLDAAQKAKGAR